MNLYDAGIRTLDRELGRLLRWLEERGLFENSIVILTSDHGEEFFEHGSWLHRQFYAECVAVPLLIRVPEGHARTSDALVGLVDLMPTVLEWCGVPAPELQQGRSLANLLRDPAADLGREALVLGRDEELVGAVTQHFSLLRRGKSRWRLFALDRDPGQQRDLARDPGYAAVLEELRSTLDRQSAQMAAHRRHLLDGRAVPRLERSEAELLESLGYAERDQPSR